jgi:hypothetical protein
MFVSLLVVVYAMLFSVMLFSVMIKICLNETYSKVHTGKHLSDNFPIQNGLKHMGHISFWLMLMM